MRWISWLLGPASPLGEGISVPPDGEDADTSGRSPGPLQGREKGRGACSRGSAAALLQWPARLRPVQRLDRTLFIQAEDHRVLRRVQLPPNHIRELFLEGRISAHLEGPYPVRLPSARAPHPVHEAMGGPSRPRPRPARPVRGLRRLGRRRPTDHLASEFGLGLGARAPVVAAPRALLGYPFPSPLGPASSPATDRVRVRSPHRSHGLVRPAFRGPEHHLRPRSPPDRCAARARPPLPARSVRLRPLEVNRYSQDSSFSLSV